MVVVVRSTQVNVSPGLAVSVRGPGRQQPSLHLIPPGPSVVTTTNLIRSELVWSLRFTPVLNNTNCGPLCLQSGVWERFQTFYFPLGIIAEQIMGKKTRMKWRRLDILPGDQTLESSPDVLIADSHQSPHSHHSHPALKVSPGWFALDLLSQLTPL